MKGGCGSEGEIVWEDRTDKINELSHVKLRVVSVENEVNHIWMRWVLRSFCVGSETSENRMTVENKDGV